MEARRLELEAIGVKRLELDRLVVQAMQLATEFKETFVEGTMEEKRLLIRAFVMQMDLNPADGTGMITFMVLPGIENSIENSCYSIDHNVSDNILINK